MRTRSSRSAGTAPRISSDAFDSAPVRTASEERDRPIGQPPDRVREDRRRALVEELDVVDRDDDRAIRLDELAEQPGDRDRQRPLVGRRAARRGAQERDRERVALRRGKPGEDVVADAAEEIDEPAERQSLLGLRRPRREDEPAALGGVVGGGLPDGRLPDPGLALEDERRQPVPGPRQERLECGELGAPPHDLVGHGAERTPATRIRSSSRSMERAPRWFHGDMTVPLPPDGAPPRVAVAGIPVSTPDGTFTIGRDEFPQFEEMRRRGVHVQSERVRIAHPSDAYVEAGLAALREACVQLGIPEAYLTFVETVEPPPTVGLRYGFQGGYTTDLPNHVWIFANWTTLAELRGVVRHEAAHLEFARTHTAEESAGHSGPSEDFARAFERAT